jgi:hypothetical protein
VVTKEPKALVALFDSESKTASNPASEMPPQRKLLPRAYDSVIQRAVCRSG